MKENTIYLSGAMLDCTGEKCRDWGEYAKLHLNCQTLDPLVRD